MDQTNFVPNPMESGLSQKLTRRLFYIVTVLCSTPSIYFGLFLLTSNVCSDLVAILCMPVFLLISCLFTVGVGFFFSKFYLHTTEDNKKISLSLTGAAFGILTLLFILRNPNLGLKDPVGQIFFIIMYLLAPGSVALMSFAKLIMWKKITYSLLTRT